MKTSLARRGLLGLVGSCCLWGATGACGGDDADDGVVTIGFLRHDNPNYRKADNEFFAEYMATHPKVKIKDVTVDFRSLAAMLTGDLKRDAFNFDLVLIPPSRVCAYAAHLAEVPPAVGTLATLQNDFYRAPLQGSICGGKLYGLPVEYNLEYGGVVVNLDKFAAKFAPRTPGWATWTEFIEDAKALTEYDDTGKPMANGLDIDPEWSEPVKHIFFSLILQHGGTYWTEGGLFNFDTQAARDSLTTMVSWVVDHKIMHKEIVPTANTNVVTRLAAGATGHGWGDPKKPLAIMGYLGTWGVPSTIEQLPPGTTWRYDFAPLPPMVGDRHVFVQNSGWAYAVPRTSRHQAVAWDIARSMALNPEVMRKWLGITGALPALRALGATMTHPSLPKVRGLLEDGQWLGYIPVGAIDGVSGALVNNFYAVVEKQKTIETALRDMQNTSNELIMKSRD